MSRFFQGFLITLLLLVDGQGSGQETTAVLSVYYSAQGHTQAMAEAVAKGARSVSGVNVKLLPVAEATTKEVLAQVQNLIKLRRQLRERFSREVVLKPGEIAIAPAEKTLLFRATMVTFKAWCSTHNEKCVKPLMKRVYISRLL